MNPFNKANILLHDILISEDYITDIGFDAEFSPDFLYQSDYPLVIPEKLLSTQYRFMIQLFRYCPDSHSLRIIDLEYRIAPDSKLTYEPRLDLNDDENEFGKNFIKKERFLNLVKPLLLEGFREVSLRKLIGNE